MSEINPKIKWWLEEIDAAKEREKDYRKDGKEILKIYSGGRVEEIPFNILFSNTETMFPALYSTVPRPVVERRFKDNDEIAKAAAQAGKRVLEFLLDTNVEGYETFDQGMRGAVLDALLPGRGVTCVKYDAEVGEMNLSIDDDVPSEDDEEAVEGPGPDGSVTHELAEGEEPEPAEYKKSELVCCDTRSWNRVYFGYAKKWSKVPWVAFEEDIDQEEAKRLFGEEVASQLSFTKGKKDEAREDQDADKDNRGERKTALIYQIWDKEKREIKYLSESYKTDFLKVTPDPLQLTGFFNMPRPLMFMEKSNDLTPTALYKLYENQAKELNRLTLRINKIVEAIKARGIYDGELGDDIKTLMDAPDNELVPADKSSSFAAEKGLQNAIWFMPLEVLVQTLHELNIARESCKQVIYEIMGIADIMRGASNASETLGAQQIKQNWGNLRLKRVQKEVQRYARDLLRIMLEIAATKFSVDTWRKMTGLPFPTAEEKASAQKQLQMLQMQQQQAAMMAQQSGQQPPPPQPPDQNLVNQAQSPSWEEIIATLRDDMQRAYRVDVETNSTVEPEAAEDQKNIQDLMGALGQFLNGIGPLVAQGVMPFQAAQAMLLAITRRYRFGTEIEDQIKAMQPPKQADPGAEAQAKAQSEMQKHQMTLQADQQREQALSQERLQSAQIDAQKEAAKASAQAQADAAKEAEITKREEIKAELARFQKMQEEQSKKDIARNQAMLTKETELQKAALQGAVTIEVARIKASAKAAETTATAEKAGADTKTMERILSTQNELLKLVANPVNTVRPK